MEIVLVPLINANEDEVEVIEVRVADGEEIKSGDVIAVVESTKAAMEVEAPASGFVRNVVVDVGQRVKVETPICAITATAVEAIDFPQKSDTAGEFKATKKARALAEKHNIDIAALGLTGIVKERDVLAAVGRTGPPTFNATFQEVVIWGAGGHAKVMVDILREGRRDLHIRGVVDDSATQGILGLPLLGNSNKLGELKINGVNYGVLGVGAVTNNSLRVELFQKMVDLGFEMPNVIHPRAIVEPSVKMGSGNQLFAGATVSSDVRLGDNTIINSGVVVSHDCTIGSHTHLTPGAILAGGVTVGENTVVGMGVTIYLGVTIGRDVVISNGVHVMQDVPDGTIVRA